MKKYKLNKGFIFQKNAKKISIFDSEKSTLFTLNETASAIFEKIKKGAAIPTIEQELIKQYSISKKRAKADIKELISKLIKKKIVSL